jgi:hypothetical protein
MLDLRRRLRRFLFAQLFPNDPRQPDEVPIAACPQVDSGDKVNVFNSAAATFYAPSDSSGIGGMRREQIRSCPRWRNSHPRQDCVFVNTNPELNGMRGLEVARILCFFSFKYDHQVFPCAVVRWFDKVQDEPDEDTGMWMVRPGVHQDGSHNTAIIHVDTIYRAAHLIPVYGAKFIPHTLKFHESYDAFRAYYVNKYVDHHAFEIAF